MDRWGKVPTRHQGPAGADATEAAQRLGRDSRTEDDDAATVAFEFASLGVPDTVENGLSRAERMLLPGGKKCRRAGDGACDGGASVRRGQPTSPVAAAAAEVLSPRPARAATAQAVARAFAWSLVTARSSSPRDHSVSASHPSM